MSDRSIEAQNFAKNASGFAAGTLLSRVFGYFRDAAIVYVFGSGRLSDAYYAAFRITNFIRRTFGEGAVNPAFLPALESEKARSPAAGRELFSALFSAVALAALLLAAVGIVFAQPIVRLVSAGFAADPALLKLTALLARILFLQVILVAVSTLCQGTLYLEKRFLLPAFAPVLFSGAILCYLGLGSFSAAGAEAKIKGLAAAAVFGGLLQAAALAFALKKSGYSFRFSTPWRDPRVRAAGVLVLPALLCAAGDQVATFIEMFFASFLPPGSVTAVYNSARVMQLPLGLFAVAAANVALAGFAKNAASGDTAGLRGAYLVAVNLTGFLLVPATAGLALIGFEAVRALFEHGKFGYSQSVTTYKALFWSVWGLAAFGINKISVMAFYALKDWRTPLKIMAVQSGAGVLLSLLLMPAMGIGGLTLASSVGAWCSALLLVSALGKRIGGLGGAVIKRYLKFAAAALIMVAACYAVKTMLSGAVPLAVMVAAVVAAGAAAYLGAARLLNIGEANAVFSRGAD